MISLELRRVRFSLLNRSRNVWISSAPLHFDLSERGTRPALQTVKPGLVCDLHPSPARTCCRPVDFRPYADRLAQEQSVPAGQDDFRELVRSRTDIVQLIGETVSLQPQRGGRLFVGLCPFHDDHNPSMQVNPERQTYKCWVCGEGGDCYSYVMKRENVNFREAIEQLAERAHVELPKTLKTPGSGGKTQDLYAVLSWGQQQFHEHLKFAQEAEPARQYFRNRGLTPAIIDQFKLGYHPADWEWLQRRAQGHFSTEQLVAARLIAPRENSAGFYDYFVDRVLFPILDERGRPVAFGGRILPGSTNPAKYWNSPESPLFAKSRLCYGLSHAREGIRKTDTVVVVEGYTDCIKAHQQGVTNVVGTLGTALTDGHVTLLKRLARKIVLVYDGDNAGIAAAERAVPRFLAQAVDLRVMTLPDGLDPDEFLDARGAEAFGQQIANATEASEYKLQTLIRRYGTQSLDARQRILEEMLIVLVEAAGMAGTTREGLLVSRLHERLGISELDVRKRLQQLRSQSATLHGSSSDRGSSSGHGSFTGRGSATSLPSFTVSGTDGSSSAGVSEETRRETQWHAAAKTLQQRPGKDDLLECELLQVLLTRPGMISVASQKVGLDEFQSEVLREIYGISLDLFEQGDEPAIGRILAGVESPALKSLIVWIDEQAHGRKVDERLSDDDSLPLNLRDTGLLASILKGFSQRRAKRSHEALRGRLVEIGQDAAKVGTQPVPTQPQGRFTIQHEGLASLGHVYTQASGSLDQRGHFAPLETGPQSLSASPQPDHPSDYDHTVPESSNNLSTSISTEARDVLKLAIEFHKRRAAPS
jgi:DNA primase